MFNVTGILLNAEENFFETTNLSNNTVVYKAFAAINKGIN